MAFGLNIIEVRGRGSSNVNINKAENDFKFWPRISFNEHKSHSIIINYEILISIIKQDEIEVIKCLNYWQWSWSGGVAERQMDVPINQVEFRVSTLHFKCKLENAGDEFSFKSWSGQDIELRQW